MNTGRYDRTSRILHWVSAAVIIWASLSGFYLATLDSASALRAGLSFFNVSLTTVFTPIFFVRVVHAIRTDKPPSLDVPRWQQKTARFVHTMLYALTSVVLASGILMMNEDINVFGVFTLPNVVNNNEWHSYFHVLHRHSSAVLFLLLLVHIAAVVRHQHAGRPVLARMR